MEEAVISRSNAQGINFCLNASEFRLYKATATHKTVVVQVVRLYQHRSNGVYCFVTGTAVRKLLGFSVGCLTALCLLFTVYVSYFELPI